jgi:DNA repair protein RadC
METLLIYEIDVRLSNDSIADSKAIYQQMTDIKDIDKEMFVCFCLDTHNKIISREIISIGSLNTSLIHPRELFKSAILKSANSIIVAHNHPSGDSQPSTEDIEITKQLVKAGKILGIPLLDHIVVGHNSYVSMTNKGMIR